MKSLPRSQTRPGPANHAVTSKTHGIESGVHSMNRCFSWGAIALLVLAVSATAQVGDKVFIEGARIVPVVGPEIEKGNILIENGKIVAIGAEIEKPFDARVIDAVGRVAFPGWVDPMNSRGLDVSNENLDVVPFLEVYDAIDQLSSTWNRILAAQEAVQLSARVLDAEQRQFLPDLFLAVL